MQQKKVMVHAGVEIIQRGGERAEVPKFTRQSDLINGRAVTRILSPVVLRLQEAELLLDPVYGLAYRQLER